MEIQINNPADLIDLVKRNDVSIENAVTVCKVFFDAGGIPFCEPYTTKATILKAIEIQLKNNIKGLPMVFCETI